MDLTAILTLVLGSGGTGLIALVYKFVTDARKGKVESEETLLTRINVQSAKDTERATAAEARADKAEAETEEWRAKFFSEQEKSSYYRAHMRTNGLVIPKWPPDEDEVSRG